MGARGLGVASEAFCDTCGLLASDSLGPKRGQQGATFALAIVQSFTSSVRARGNNSLLSEKKRNSTSALRLLPASGNSLEIQPWGPETCSSSFVLSFGNWRICSHGNCWTLIWTAVDYFYYGENVKFSSDWRSLHTKF